MANLEFSVPYNDDPETLDEIFKLKNCGNNKISEVYLSGPQEFSGSGRITPKLNQDIFFETVKKIHDEGIRVNLVMNSTCEGSGWYSSATMKKLLDFISIAHCENGVETVTIVNPILIKALRRNFPRLQICASVLSEIDCVQRAILFQKAGANVITPDMNINRELKLLQEIRDITGLIIKPMVNEGCLYKCPFRRFHFNYVSHASKDVIDEPSIFFDNCVQVSAQDPSQVLKSCWIRPEDMHKYNEITNYFKIVGRSTPKNKVIRCIKAYMKESWDGGLLDIMCDSFSVFNSQYGVYIDNKKLDRYGFFEKVTSCDRECHKCGYCEDLAKKLFVFRQYSKELQEEVY